MLRCLLKASAENATHHRVWSRHCCFSSMSNSNSNSKPSKSKSMAMMEPFEDVDDKGMRAKEDQNDNSSLFHIVGPNGGRPLFTSAPSLSALTHNHCASYFDFTSIEQLNPLDSMIPCALPCSFATPFWIFVIISGELFDPPMWPTNHKAPKARKQIVLDGPRSSGKSITLAMLVHWARDEGWLVFYVPNGRSWTHGGFFYRNPQTGLWDTPERSSLYDLVVAGVDRTYSAVGVVVRLREELSMVKDVPVLIAVDQYNKWFTFSEYQEPETVRSCKPIHSRELTTVRN